MSLRKYISILLCAALIVCSFAACSAPQPAFEEVEGTAPSSDVSGVSETAAALPSETASQTEAPSADVSSTEAASVTVSETAAASTTAAATVKVQEETTAATTKSVKNTSKKKSSSKVSTTKAEKTYIDIVLQKNRKAKCKSSNVSIATGEVIIEKAGDYRITSTTKDWHGQIIVKLPNTAEAELRFENVNISSNTNIIQIIDKSIKTNRSFLESESATAEDEIKEVSDFDKAPNVDLSFPEGTKSTFTTTANSVTGALYNESKLEIRGHGSVTFASAKNANNCICSTKSIRIKNVSLNLTTAQNESTSTLASNTGSAKGIYSYNKVTLESGTLNIKTNGDAIRCDEYEQISGDATICSSACDGIDADDSIIISGGTIISTALEKACYKVRRINNTETGTGKGVRAGKNDTFAINGGTVIGEGKRITTVQPASKQASLTCKIVKPSRGTEAAKAESKVPAVISIASVSKSSKSCTKYLYSAKKVSAGKEYTATANGKSGKAAWNGSVGTIEIESTNNR